MLSLAHLEKTVYLNSNEHIEALQKRLVNIFELKAAEFTKYSEENPHTSQITTQVAGMYEDLARVMRS
ncbi:hypothetical protein KF707_01780 [Candidatus Obscuribacterales bacterium]|nr:hypothetical protein [Candidatus Obscuribacterales bacterium]MBX3150683.1 hypothetical protein [Candidatus Obscuribacterales bacterium]